MRASSFALGIIVPLLLAISGCEEVNSFDQPPGPYDLTFTGDASFQDAHGGQSIEVAVIDQASGEIVETASGTVSATEDPSFEFSFPDALQRNHAYFIDYWIDSNFAGGTEATCDPPANDHQWRAVTPGVISNYILDDEHRPGETESVCDSFQ